MQLIEIPPALAEASDDTLIAHLCGIPCQDDVTSLLLEVMRLNAVLSARNGAASPWRGYIAITDEDGVIGTCGFKGPPKDGAAEIAYFTFPPFAGRGFAKQMARKLEESAMRTGALKMLIAHTLPEANASTAILKGMGFRNIGEVIDPEDGKVWRWEKDIRP
jgi:[ribosomal protein S5]-alanine N-acetyltransferase